MKAAVYLSPLLALVVIFLVWAEIRARQRLVYVLKPLATLAVIAMALLSFLEPSHNRVYSAGVLVGLLFSFGGDVALMFQGRKAFTIGLGLFLVAHVVYAAIFTVLGRASATDILSAVVLSAVAVGVYRLIRCNLGKLRVPVIAYIAVISVMVHRAVTVFAGPLFDAGQAAMVLMGAVLFYISDGILAVNRFCRPWRYHRVSLLFYYGGQALIALAASHFRAA